MPEWNSEVFAARVTEQLKRSRGNAHSLRNFVETENGKINCRLDKVDDGLEKLRIDNAKHAWLYPLITSGISGIVLYVLMHVIKATNK